MLKFIKKFITAFSHSATSKMEYRAILVRGNQKSFGLKFDDQNVVTEIFTNCFRSVSFEFNLKNPYKICISYFDTCPKCYYIIKKIINFDIFDFDVILWLLYERKINLFRWKSLTIDISALSYHFKKVLLPL